VTAGKKVYFASDFHLGANGKFPSIDREKRVVRWLDTIRADAAEIFLVGDIFDFWFEYRKVVPRGFVRILGKLSELTDSGVKVTMITGNHDMWMFGYLSKEVDITVHSDPIERSFNDKRFLIGHGDGLGPGDRSYKIMKRIFRSRLLRWMFARLHPNAAFAIGHYWSRKSRFAQGAEPPPFRGEEREWQVVWCKEKLESEHFDYFVFGHRHLALDIELPDGSRYINLGDWLSLFTYAEFDGQDLTIRKFE
jgi:UDP-2,3-diacylglucosamine hydrolase